jgi:hypothetical protein
MPTAQEQLDEVAKQKREELFTVNNYKPTESDANEYNTAYQPGTPYAGGEYSEQSPDAVSDGDQMGKGYLGSDIGKDQPEKVGSSDDIVERKKEVVKNVYNTAKEYPNF